MPVTRTPWRSCAIASAIAPLPGPDVEHALAVLGQLDEQLRLGTRHEHAMVHDQLELAEVGAPEDVGDRLAPHAAAHHVVERERRVHVEPSLRVGVQRRAVHVRARRPAAPRRRAAACRRRRPPGSRRPRPGRRAGVRSPSPSSRSPRRQAAWASSLRRRSSAASASVNSLELALEHRLEVVRRELDAVVGDPALRDSCRCAPSPSARRVPTWARRSAASSGLLLAQRVLVQARAQHAQRALAILQLRLLVLHRDHQPRRLVRDPHRRVGRVDRLPARAGGAVHVDLQVVRVDRRPRRPPPRAAPRPSRSRCGCGPATPSAGTRWTRCTPASYLNTLYAPSPLIANVTSLKPPAGEALWLSGLGLEAAPLRVPGQHPVEVAGEQRRLVAPGAGRISTITFLSSFGSRSTIARRSCSASSSISAREPATASSWNSRRSRSSLRRPPSSSSAPAALLSACRYSSRELVRVAQLPMAARHAPCSGCGRPSRRGPRAAGQLAVALLDLLDSRSMTVGAAGHGSRLPAQATTSMPRRSSSLDLAGSSTASTASSAAIDDRELVERRLAGGQLLELQAGPHQAAHPALAPVAPGPADHLVGEPGDERDARRCATGSASAGRAARSGRTRTRAMIITISRKLVPQRTCRRE